jgi:hypothetical protein
MTISGRGPLSVSLPALFFAIIATACIARWLVHFGSGVAVILAWSFVLGGAIGGGIGLVMVIISWILQIGRGSAVADRNQITNIAGYAFTSAITALICACLGFAAAAFGPVERVRPTGAWFEAFLGNGPDAVEITRVITLFTLGPAVLGALSNSIAQILQQSIRSRSALILHTSIWTALVLGPVPVVLLIIAITRLPKARGLEHEWFGLWPLAAILYFAIFAAIGALSGAVFATIRVWIDSSQKSRASNATFWAFSVVTTIIVTEAALRGWIGQIYRLAANVP